MKKKWELLNRLDSFSTGCSKAMPCQDSEEKIEIDKKVPDTSMHQAWGEPVWIPGGSVATQGTQ